MNNAEWMIKQGYKFSDLELEDRGNEFKIYLKENCVGKYPQGFTMLEAAMKWLDMEHIEPILDEAEKRYLSAVIRPFKNRVDWISKVSDDVVRRYFIEIYIITNGFDECISLPYFDGSEMYKGMESDKKYTLEELGL